MVCDYCGGATSGGACLTCGRRVMQRAPAAVATPMPGGSHTDAGTATLRAPLEPGQLFATRYRIDHVLGAGGMGVVYQAWDEALGVTVALKTIRGDGGDADSTLRRFKRELLHARQVTHRNVVRIHDLGEAGGIAFISMDFIEGTDLATELTRHGRFNVPEAIAIVRQVAAGLDAAHVAGVVHRDLKPANVMLAADGRAVVMDFGISRSRSETTTLEGLTVTGAIIGTMEYMSPEQAAGSSVDHRCDIYALGLITYDLLTGAGRTKSGGSALQELMTRIERSLPPLTDVAPDVPAHVSDAVQRCLERDPASRYQRVWDFVDALGGTRNSGAWPAGSPGIAPAGTASFTVPRPGTAASGSISAPAAAPIVQTVQAPTLTPRLRYATAAVALVGMLGTTAWWTGVGVTPAPVQRDPLSVLVADFKNGTGEPLFEGSVEQALAIGLEGASFLTAYARRDAERAAAQIAPGAPIDERVARLVSQREGIKIVIAGAIERSGDGYRIVARAIDPVPGTEISQASVEAATKGDVLQAVGRAATLLREALGDSEIAGSGSAGQETFTATSLEAAHDYSTAQALANANKDEEAIAHYRRATERDPEFGRAYSGWANSEAKLGRTERAKAMFEKALSLANRMTEREKYRTYGAYYLQIADDQERAIENYTALLERYPADGAAHNNLAVAYFRTREFRKALEQHKQLLAIYPKSVLYRTNYALYAMYAGDFDMAAREARAALELNPNTPKAHLALAMAALAAGKPNDARAAYALAGKTGTRGASLAVMGLADVAMYEKNFADAVAILEPGIAKDRETQNTAGAAAKEIALAEALLKLGRQPEAVAAAGRAAALARTPSILVPAAEIYLATGRLADAKKLSEILDSGLSTQERASARLVRGRIAAQAGDTSDGVSDVREAVRLHDLWFARLQLGRAYLLAGSYPQALGEFEQCERRLGEVTAVFLDDVPSFRYRAVLQEGIEQARAGLNKTGTAR